MKIESVRIENLRSFKDETVRLNDYTCLVGPNGSGKSTVLCALNIFFRETAHSSTDLTNLQEQDFHGRDTSKPIRITVTFADLNTEAQEDFKDYFRLGKLVVTSEATFDQSKSVAVVKQYGQRLGMPAFEEYFRAQGDGAKVADLKVIYQRLVTSTPDLPKAGTGPQMSDALHAYEAARPDECKLMPSDDEFYGFAKGTNRLAKYIQWVFVPAVKDASEEQTEAKNTALGQLMARAVRARVNFAEPLKKLRDDAMLKYEELLSQSQTELDGLSAALKSRLLEWAHPDASLKLEWHHDIEKGVTVSDPFAEIVAGEGSFEGSLCRFGHGLQRSYLLALLQVLAGGDDPSGPRLILGCEEPELYQHPPQARHLAGVFEKLCSQNAQIVVTTHSPYFVSGQRFEDVRLARKCQTGASSISQVTFDQLAQDIAAAKGEKPWKPSGVLAKVHQELLPGLNEMFFAPVLILVEGVEDVAHITTYLHLTGSWDEYRRLGCHVVPANCKSNMIKPLAIAKRLNIPVFTIFDADADEQKPERLEQHRKDNLVLLNLCGAGGNEPLPKGHLWLDGLVVWSSNMGTAVKVDFNLDDRTRYIEKASCAFGNVGDLHKNVLHIAEWLKLAWDDGKKSASLQRLCESIVTFAKAHSPAGQQAPTVTQERTA